MEDHFNQYITINASKEINTDLYNSEYFMIDKESMQIPVNYPAFFNLHLYELYITSVIVPETSKENFRLKIAGTENPIEIRHYTPNIMIPFREPVIIRKQVVFSVSVPCLLFGYWRMPF